MCLLSLEGVQNKIKMAIAERAQVIEFVPLVPRVKTPVTVISPSILIDDKENPLPTTPKSVVPKPYITAESYLVANLETGEKYIDFNSGKVFPIASVSKLYTALVVHHLFDLEKDITITQPMLDSYGDNGHLVLDEKFKPNELLGALLLESSNDAAEAFAQSYGYTDFMNEMNGFAQEIGMSNTSFKDASGLSARNISSALDLFTLSRYLYKSEKDILDISKTGEIILATTTDHGAHRLVNINPYSVYSEFAGGKTGRTREAREVMVSLFNKKVGDRVYPIAVIVLRSDFGEREINTEKLLGLFDEKIASL
jgi:D-alanyl-D-alanine carboxypeptidase